MDIVLHCNNNGDIKLFHLFYFSNECVENVLEGKNPENLNLYGRIIDGMGINLGIIDVENNRWGSNEHSDVFWRTEGSRLIDTLSI